MFFKYPSITMIVLIVACCIPFETHADTYFWIDKDGVKHFSNTSSSTLSTSEPTNIEEVWHDNYINQDTPHQQHVSKESSQGYELDSWEIYERTHVKGMISGTITRGFIIQMQSGSIFQVSSVVAISVAAVSPEVLVFYSGNRFKLIIDDFDEPLDCTLLKKSGHNTSPSVDTSTAIFAHIDGEFEGWEGTTIFKLDNGQIWQQSAYAYTYHYAYRPEVLIFNHGGSFKMKVDGIGNMIEVVRLK